MIGLREAGVGVDRLRLPVPRRLRPRRDWARTRERHPIEIREWRLVSGL